MSRPAGRRRGWSGSRRRRRRTRARRSAPGRTATGPRTRPRPPAPTVAFGAPRAAEHDAPAGAAIDGDDPQAPVEARAGALDLGAQPRRASWPAREQRRSSARATAPPPPGPRCRPRASGANVAPSGQRQSPARRAACSAARPATRRRSARGGRRDLGAGVGGPARRRPATRRAATIAPAEVPTKYSQRRRSKPVASSIPASTPIIQASPSTPPAPRTRTSGRDRMVGG